MFTGHSLCVKIFLKLFVSSSSSLHTTIRTTPHTRSTKYASFIVNINNDKNEKLTSKELFFAQCARL